MSMAIAMVLSIGITFGQVKTGTEQFVNYNDKPVTYEIGAISIEGSGSRDENAIKSIAGLREGGKVTIPGEEISKGIKALYKLRLFENVEIIQEKIEGDLIFIKIILKERPILSRYSFKGVKKGQMDDLSELVDEALTKGGIVTVNGKEIATQKIKDFYIEKGYFDTEVAIHEVKDEVKDNAVRLEFEIDINDRIKISDITFQGNRVLKGKKLRGIMKNTKRKGTFLRKSKFIEEKFVEDKERIIEHYNKMGYRDARIVKDTMWRDAENLLRIHFVLEEGEQYHFRNITWKGNSIYTDEQLSAVLGINEGEIFNRELLDKRLSFSLDGRDISSLYLDQGYLFFDIKPTEISVDNHDIDIEMRISEGPQATIDKVIIQGNDRTNEHVIRREIRTRPGEKFSRSDIIRSQRQIINLGYFNPENLDINTPVNQQRGTVDIEYTVEERPSDQLELSAGYGGFSGLIGTLGVTFNNFSTRNITDKSAWSPLPQGDGQKLSLRVQSNSRFYRSANFSFTEPWLGGRKPNSFSVGGALSSFDNTTFGGGALTITRLFVGLGTQLKFPDDFFVSSSVLNMETINLDNYPNQFLVDNGNFKNFNIKQTISRSSVNEPLFPRRGSKISLSVQLTPPYSLFRKDNFWLMSEEEKSTAIRQENEKRGFLNQLNAEQEANHISNIEQSRKFSLLEYHKWRFDAEWYFNLVGNLVMMTSAKLGFLGSYNSAIGAVPFERYEYGGDGLSNQNVGITGMDIVSMRGYDTDDFAVNNNGGGTIFNKYTVELRYPLSTNPNSTIYMHGFLQAGNVWQGFDNFNPFELKRSVGAGMRVFLPMFGLLGFDYGFGIDKNIPIGSSASYSKFSIILGFEPD